jgi:hypothetical protein
MRMKREETMIRLITQPTRVCPTGVAGKPLVLDEKLAG